MDKNKVLIVDDQNGIRILLMEVFSSEGYNTFQASNGKLALEIVRNDDVLILFAGYEDPWNGRAWKF